MTQLATVVALHLTLVLLSGTFASLMTPCFILFIKMTRWTSFPFALTFVIFSLSLRTGTFAITRCHCISLARDSSSLKALFLQFQVLGYVIKSIDVLIVSHMNLHMFPTIGKGSNHSLNLLFICECMSSWLQFSDHVWHFPKMLGHRMIRALLISVKLDSQFPKLGSRGATKLIFQGHPHSMGSVILLKFAHHSIIHTAQQRDASNSILPLPGHIGLRVPSVLSSRAMLRFYHHMVQWFSGFLLLQNELNFTTPHVVIITIEFLTLIQFSHDILWYRCHI